MPQTHALHSYLRLLTAFQVPVPLHLHISQFPQSLSPHTPLSAMTMTNRGRGRGGRGRGRFFANRYGPNHSNSRRDVAHSSSHPSSSGTQSARYQNEPDMVVPSRKNGTVADLSNFIKSVDKASYPAYKDLRGCWQLSDTISLIFDHVQGDAYASPSRARLRVSLKDASFPPQLYQDTVRRTAFCDYLTRKFAHFARIARLDQKRTSRTWSAVKGGHITIDAPGQHVLERSSCILDGDCIEMRVGVALPARGRTIEGQMADESLTQVLPVVASKALFAQGEDQQRIEAHVASVAEQHELRGKLRALGLVAFVADGAILPRASGDSDRPMEGDEVVRFESPESLAVNVTLSSDRHLRGMGIRGGVSLVVGGGFHGKSTLLSALQVGVYNHVPGDGREFVCVIDESVAIRAEDGRFVCGVDISPFINNLPFGKSTERFSTVDASGSTSQAANIIEAIEAGAKLLLIDEDLSATNFMMRDKRMQELVPAEKEPITPMIERIRGLYEHEGVSSILVVGGSGDYFAVSDTVVMMDCYRPCNVTARAKEIAQETGSGMEVETSVAGMFKAKRKRCLSSQSLRNVLSGGKGRVTVRSKGEVEVGNERIDLSAVAQLVEASQTRAIGAALETLSSMRELETEGVKGCVDKLMQGIDERGLDVVNCRGERMGFYARPRLFEMQAALNRVRGLELGE